MNNLDIGICVNIYEYFSCVFILLKKGYKLYICDINRICYFEQG